MDTKHGGFMNSLARTIQGLALAGVAAVVLSANASLGAAIDKSVRAFVEARNLCAKIDFGELELNTRDGITDLDSESHERIRAGDRLLVHDVDVGDDGYVVEIDFRSAHSRDNDAEAELHLYRSVQGKKGALQNEDELLKALDFFTVECEQQEKQQGEGRPQ